MGVDNRLSVDGERGGARGFHVIRKTGTRNAERRADGGDTEYFPRLGGEEGRRHETENGETRCAGGGTVGDAEKRGGGGALRGRYLVAGRSLGKGGRREQ